MYEGVCALCIELHVVLSNLPEEWLIQVLAVGFLATVEQLYKDPAE